MKTISILAVAGVAISVLTTPLLAASDITHALAFGLRQHTERTDDLEAFHFDDDLSYGLAYQCRDGVSYWQFGVNFTPDPSQGEDVDMVITPEMNLVLAESFWRLGVGMLKDYVEASGGNDWGDIYWQAIAGIGIPVGSFRLEISALYVMDSLSDIGDVDIDDIEYGAWLGYVF